MTYAPFLVKQYLKAKYDNKIEVKNKELYSLCGCENDKQKGSIRALKHKYLKQFENAIDPVTIFPGKVTNANPNNSTVLSDKVSKHPTHQIQGVSENHILSIIKVYPELPLFIYSKIFESVKSEYDKLEEDRHKEYKINGKVIKNYRIMTFSFYDMYIEIFNDINEGKLDKEIKEYMKDIINSFGNTHTLELEGVEFNQDFDDYEYFLKWVLEIIADIVDYFTKPYNYNELRIQMLYYLLVKSTGFDNHLVSNIVEQRTPSLIKSDILKLYILWKKTIPTDMTINDLYDEFDLRYSDKLDLVENGINYDGRYDDIVLF